MSQPKFEAFESLPAEKTITQRTLENEGQTSEELEVERASPAEDVRVGAPSQPPKAFTNIEVTRLDDNIFVGEEATLWRPPDARGVYGGQIIGQALSAATQTVPAGKSVHSLHCYFVMKGDNLHKIVYRVETLRDGASFSTRLVTAQQHGKVIFLLVASFQVRHVGRSIEHQVQMPMVPKPAELPTMEEYYAALLLDPRCPQAWRPFIEKRTKSTSPLAMRPVIVSDFFHVMGPPPASRPRFPELSLGKPRQAYWMRANSPLPDDSAIHTAVLAYASDMGLLSTAKHSTPTAAIGVIASLDHALWIHSSFRADEWLLFYLESQRATDGRGTAYGTVYSENGRLVASVAQEGVIRLKRERQTSESHL